jgi:hypothetical protein
VLVAFPGEVHMIGSRRLSRMLGCSLALVATLADPIAGAAQTLVNRGTEVTIVLDQDVTSRTASTGETVRLHTAADVTIGGRFVPRGAAVRATVIRAKRAGRRRRPGELEIGELTILGPDGGPLAESEAVIRVLAPRRVARDFYAKQAAAEGRILTGMAAGYGGAWLASQWADSEDTVAASGLLAGVAATGLMQVVPRGPDLQISRGAEFSFVFGARFP